MKEGRKLYSLIIEDEMGNYYRLKIDGNYQNPLAVIDTYTTSYQDSSKMYEGLSYIFKLHIVNAFIIYHKDEKTKSLVPIFKDMEIIGNIAKSFENSSEIDNEDKKAYLNVLLLATKLMNSYYEDKKVKEKFDQDGDYIVLEALRGHDMLLLTHRLCAYRKLRKSMILLDNVQGKKQVNPFPRIIDAINPIKQSDERLLELINEQILTIQNATNRMPLMGQAKMLADLYDKKNELEEALGKADRNVKGQMRLF